jgi:4-amino-4-deoxy-L-arabinose transferase-like glycosyltransferase
LLALVVRLLGIVSRPIWYDEAFAILFSAKGPAAMLYGTLTPTGAGAADIHPLGYYTLLWLWMQTFGQSLVATRLLSILAGTTTVFLVWLLARELFNEKIAFVASLFVALAPFQVHYSQEIRMYSFLALWLLLATYAYVRGAKGGGVRWWILFAVSAALAQYTHNLAGFYLVPLALTPLLRRDWKSLRSVVLAGMGALLLYLPWLIQLPSQLAKVSSVYWVERPGVEKLFTLLLVYVTNLPLPNNTLLFVGLFIALAVFIIAATQTFRRNNRNANALWLFYLAFAPPLLLFLISQWIPVYIERALLPSGVLFCVWLAWALFDTSLPRVFQYGLVGLLAAGAGMGIYQHVTYRGFPYAPFREMETSIQSRMQAGDAIVHASKATLLPSAYYNPDLPQTFIADPPGSGIDTYAPATQQVVGRIASPDMESATRGARRVWFIVFQWHIDAYARMGRAHPLLEPLKQNYTLESADTWGDIRIYLFKANSK